MTGAAIDRLARRLGGPRVLALPLIRVLAVLAGGIWLALAPAPYRTGAVAAVVLGFAGYSALLIAALWWRPAVTLRLNVPVLLVDLGVALALIRLTGGATSTLFLALLVIAGLQSYYYGIQRGLGVAVASAVLYLALVWPTVDQLQWANMAVRLAVLLGTAVGTGLLADVEERERARALALEAEARGREAFIRRVVEGLREGVIALDAEGRIVAWNRALERRYGLPEPAVRGRTLAEVDPGFTRGPLAAALARLLRGEIEEFTLDGVEQTLARGPHVLNVKSNVLRADGQPAGAVLLLEDVTERVALERAARQAEKLAALGTLAAGVAHEINNPIGIISSRAELVLLERGTALPAGLREDLEVIHRQAQRVARIVQGLLSFARRAPGTAGPVDLNRLVEDTLLLVEKQASKDGIRLVRKLGDGLPVVRGDAQALQQVLMNLLLNARDALEGPGEIRVETARAPGAPDRVQLRVADTGCGIPPEVLPRIFDPFFTTKPTGTGLGLSIAYGIVRDHQGTLEVESEPGRGTTFTITLPARALEASA